jgi:hypothetical protein
MHLTLAQQWQVRLARFVVRPVAQHLHHDVCGPENLLAAGHHFGAFFGVLVVGMSGRFTRARFHHHLHARFAQVGQHRRHQGHPSFAWIALFGHSHNHEPPSRRRRNRQ